MISEIMHCVGIKSRILKVKPSGKLFGIDLLKIEKSNHCKKKDKVKRYETTGFNSNFLLSTALL